MLTALTHCRRLRTGLRFFTVVQAVIGAIGIAMTVGMAFVSGVLIPPLYAVEFLGVATLVSIAAAFGFSKT